VRRLLIRLWTLLLWGAYVVLVVKLGPLMGRWCAALGESNCYAWAIHQQYLHGGWVAMRQSDFVTGRHHFVYSPELVTLWEYDPPTKRLCKRPPLLFHGTPQRVTPPLEKCLADGLRVLAVMGGR